MEHYEAKNIRNIALVGHSGEGKTSLAEAFLFNGKSIDKLGTVAQKNTVMDFDGEETARGMSVSLACAHTSWLGVKLNIVDVPGFYDFEGEFEEAVRAVGSTVLVADANGVVSVGAERTIDYCLEHHIPLIIFINGIDKENADYVKTVEAFREKYGRKIATMHAPIIRDGKMQGYVSVISGKAYEFIKSGRVEIPVPPEMKDDVASLKEGLTEAAAESSDEFLDKFDKNGGWLSNDDIIVGVKAGLFAGDTIPVMGGSATQNIGVINLMNEIVSIMPSPLERKAMGAKALENDLPLEIVCDESAPFSAQVFKTLNDPFAGRLSYIRVFTGKLRSGMTVINTANGKEERIGSLYLLNGKKTEPTDTLSAGDIGAVAKLSSTLTGDTLCAVERQIAFEEIKMPPAVYAMAVSTEKPEEVEKVFAGLSKLHEEDKSFSLEKDAETGETILRGLGETQLEIICKKLLTRYGCKAVLTEPVIAYRETITTAAEAEGKHKKQSGGAGQFGVVTVRFEPGAADGIFEFEDRTVGGSVPKQFIPAVEKGLREAVKAGVVAGYPVIDVKCVLLDGKYHPVDSKEIAFVSAAKLAYEDAMTRANPVILEPIWEYVITIPSDYLGDVLGDINKRRGKILGMEGDNVQTVTAEIPLKEMQKYATALRGMTQGRGKFTCKFIRYEKVSAEEQAKIAATSKKN